MAKRKHENKSRVRANGKSIKSPNDLSLEELMDLVAKKRVVALEKEKSEMLAKEGWRPAKPEEMLVRHEPPWEKVRRLRAANLPIPEYLKEEIRRLGPP